MLKRLWLTLSVLWAGCVLIPELFATHAPGSGPGVSRLLITASLPFLPGLLIWWIVRGGSAVGRR